MGENIGTVARAMLNFGLTDLRLVRPRDGWPNPAAEAMASGANLVLDGARVFATTAEAIAGIHHVFAVTARARDSVKDLATPAEAGQAMRAWATSGQFSAWLFGPERAGLNNDDVALADTILTIPANPAFSSLNLAQAVLVTAYEWFQAGEEPGALEAESCDPPATKDQLIRLFEHLEADLDAARFFYPPERRTAMVRNLRNMLQRFQMSEQDVRTIHGMIRALKDGKGQNPEGGQD